MTENQLFPMSADFFDTSSNSSNPLKYDLYALGLSNSNSSSTLFGSTVHTLSPLHHQLTVSTASPTNSTTPTSCANSSSSSGSGSGSSSNCNSGGNVMLTNAISIPRSNNPNQSHHHNPYLDDSHHPHHPSPSPLHHHHHHHHLNHHHLHHNNSSGSSNSTHYPMMSNSSSSPHQSQNSQHQQQQQQQQEQQSRLLADLSEYGLDALDASSLSPTMLLQDVSLSAASPHNVSSSLHSIITPNGNVSTGFYAQDAASSPISHSGSVSASDAATTLLNLNAGDDVNHSLIYEVQVTPNSNTMWSDIGSAIVTTKNEPFNLEDDYIFPIDKSSGFGDMNHENFLEVIGSIEDLLPHNADVGGAAGDGQSGFMLLSPQSSSSLQQLNSPQVSPGAGGAWVIGNIEDLLPLQQQQQQSQQSQQSQRTSLQHSQSAGGAIHHSHHNHHSSSSPYEIYHSTPNKQHQLNNSAASNTFSPGSQSSHSPLQINSITPPPPPHANRSQYQQHMVKSRNMQELIKKGFSMSPDRSSSNNNNSAALLGQSMPASSHILLSGTALSPSSGSSGFGSATGGSGNAGGGGGSVRKSFAYQGAGGTPAADTSISRLSSSAPTHLGLEHIWKRREPRQHLLSTGSLAEAESFSSLSTASVLSPEGIDYSQDDDDDASTDYNSDHYDDFSSDGSDIEDDGRTGTPSQLSSSKGKERFFWQYNVQAKGPKGKRLVFQQSRLEDPHVLNEVTDPVFSPTCSVRGIKVFKHSGKARKGDGNDLTPNPRKLHSIGRELDKLSRTINDMTPVSELPFNVRPKSRKEKNKLASRACRLKKKAQHEANKIKLFGLEIEHKRLLTGIADMKQALALKYHNQNVNCGGGGGGTGGGGGVAELNEEMNQQIEQIYKTAQTGLRIAGGTTDFVNKVLDNMKAGVSNGGLEELRVANS